MKRKTIFFLFLSCFITVQAQYKATGQISNLKKEKLPGTQIILTTQDTLAGMTLTDKNGLYAIEGLKKGEYRMRIEREGYTPRMETVNLFKDMKMDFVLLEEMTDTLAEVTIHANRQNLLRTTAQGNVFYLSTTAQNRKDSYAALSEIPRLKVDELTRSITTVSGDGVLILINGVPRGGALESIDPKDILSVELMETPSARYLTDGFTNVLNIKTRKKIARYKLFNFNTQHNPGLYYGTGNGGYETGNSKYSFYINAKSFYFNNNHADQNVEQQTSAIAKQYRGRHQSDYLSYNATLGGDWVISDKDFFSYNVTFRGIPTNSRLDGEGTLTEKEKEPERYVIRKEDKTASFVNVYNAYYRRLFTKQEQLESQFNFTYNHNNDRSYTRESGVSGYDYERPSQFKMNYYNGYLQEEYRKKTNRYTFSAGSKTSFEKTSLRLPYQPRANFDHHRWKEYLHADISQESKWAGYSASLGMDMIFNRIGQKSHDYYRLKYSFSGSAYPSEKVSMKVWARGYTQEPEVAYLNPYDTSTDSLSVVRGNPLLEPSYCNQVGFSTSINWNGFYLSPEIGYSHYTDMIAPVGYTNDKNIYISTYENKERQKYLYVFGIIRYNIPHTGSVSLSGTYHRYFFYNGVRDWFTKSLYWNFHYKSFYLNGHADFEPTTYTATTRIKNSIETLTTLSWDINRAWEVMISLRYFMGGKRIQKWMEQPGYYYHYDRAFDERKNMLLVGFRYSWRKGEHKRRKNSKLKVNDNRVNLL